MRPREAVPALGIPQCRMAAVERGVASKPPKGCPLPWDPREELLMAGHWGGEEEEGRGRRAQA